MKWLIAAVLVLGFCGCGTVDAAPSARNDAGGDGAAGVGGNGGEGGAEAGAAGGGGGQVIGAGSSGGGGAGELDGGALDAGPECKPAFSCLADRGACAAGETLAKRTLCGVATSYCCPANVCDPSACHVCTGCP